MAHYTSALIASLTTGVRFMKSISNDQLAAAASEILGKPITFEALPDHAEQIGKVVCDYYPGFPTQEFQGVFVAMSAILGGDKTISCSNKALIDTFGGVLEIPAGRKTTFPTLHLASATTGIVLDPSLKTLGDLRRLLSDILGRPLSYQEMVDASAEITDLVREIHPEFPGRGAIEASNEASVDAFCAYLRGRYGEEIDLGEDDDEDDLPEGLTDLLASLGVDRSNVTVVRL